MAFKPLQYFLVHNDKKIFLFESQLQFFSEHDCLRHFEKGIAKSLFTFDRSRVDQVWCELKLWGLLGRKRPVELVRTLCGFGCDIQMRTDFEIISLQKSFYPVTYCIPLEQLDIESLRHFYHRPITQGDEDHIPLLLELEDRLVIGHYYTTSQSCADQQLIQLCGFLEEDMCLELGMIQTVLSDLFYAGQKIMAAVPNGNVVLAENDLKENIIRGAANECSLFYASKAS